MLPAEVPHPLDNLFTQFGNGQSHSPLAGVSFGPPVGQDWFSASDLANDDGALDHILERYGEIVKTDSRFLQAAMLMNLYIGPVVSPAVLGFYAGRAVTDASAPNFAIRLGETPWEAEYAFRCRHFATLSSDRAARHPDAIPAPSLEALNAWMFDKMLECHLRPLFARVRARTKLGENVMWAGVASGCAHAIMYLQRAGYFTIDEALAAKEALLEQGPKPLRNRVSVYPLESGPVRSLFMRLEVCCQKYLHPDLGKCGYCSLRPIPEQLELQQSFLNRRVAQETS